jgi:uncharacterized membrane protein
MEYWFIGLIIAFISMLIKVLGTNLQKLSHRNEDRKYCSNIHWVSGFVLTCTGAVVDMGALALAPQSMIASLGGLTLVINIFVAKMLLGENMKKIQYFTTFIIVLGTTFTIIFSPKKEEDNDISNIKKMYESFTFIFYGIFITFSIGLIRLLNHIFKKNKTHDKLRGFLLPISSGAIAAQNMFFGKTFMRLLVHSIEYKTTEIIKEYIIYVNLVCLILCLVLHVKWLNEALKNHKATLVVPINKSIWIITSIFAGIFVMGENFGDNNYTQFIFYIGILIIIIGLILHSYFETEHIKIPEISMVDIENNQIEIEINEISMIDIENNQIEIEIKE